MSDTVEAELIRWGESQPDVQAILLTSTRALENAAVDWFSDYDVIVMTSDIQSRHDDREWLETFGEIVISWWDPLETDPVSGLLTAGNVVYYPEARKIDFTLWPPEMAARIERDLPTELDAGYKVLLDKNGLTANWPSATGEGYRKQLPSCEQYLEAVNDFFIGVPYVVTALIRGEMLPAKWVLDYDMRYEYLLPMLEWYAVSIHGQSVQIGAHGKGLQPLLPAETWAKLEETYASLDVEQNRAALFAMIDLFHEVAEHVGTAIECAYPADLHDRVINHIQALGTP